ncbi:MAG: hypothetical protein ACOY0T_10610 [Myxococcota bacterium]
MKLIDRIRAQTVPGLTRLACTLALIALAVMCVSVVYPKPLAVILAMSVGHVIGGAAFALYLLAVILDAANATGRKP